MPAPRFATFLARLLTYDTHLKSRAGTAVVIAVLYDKKTPASMESGTQLTNAVKNLEFGRIVDLPVVTMPITTIDAQALEKLVAENGIDALVVAEGLEKHQDLIKTVSRRNKVITIGVTSAQVRQGLSVAVYLDDNKSKILVNLGASKAEGTVFSTDLLRLSEVIP